jgi:hypothetical protein
MALYTLAALLLSKSTAFNIGKYGVFIFIGLMLVIAVVILVRSRRSRG